MHRTVVKFPINHGLTVVLRLFSESQTLQKNHHIIKRRFPLLTFQNNLTNIFKTIHKSRTLFRPDPAAEIKHFLKENNSGKLVAARVLMDMFSLNRKEVKPFLDDNKKLQETSKKSMLSNYKLLKDHGLTKEQIQDNVVLLSEDHNVLKKKVNIILQLTNNVVDAIPFFYHDLNSLNSFIKTFNTRSENSVKYQILLIQQQLQITNKEVFFIISKYLSYLILQPEQTVQKLKLLVNYGVSINNLLNFAWPLFLSSERIESRLQLCKDELIFPIKRWMLSSNQLLIEKRVQKQRRKREYYQLLDFLSEKTGYSIEVLRYRVNQTAQVQQLSYKKSIAKINLIIKEGYNYYDIVWSIKVLTLSKNVINQRFSALQAINHKASFLDVLLLSNSNFVKYVNSKKLSS